jgi:hypothetical protein
MSGDLRVSALSEDFGGGEGFFTDGDGTDFAYPPL